MNGFNNGMMMGNNNNANFSGFNPFPMQTSDYMSRMSVNNLPRYSIIQVNGQNGADAFQMAPNSKVLLLDENNPIVWFVQTDGAGYKTVTPYSITPFQPEQPVDLHSLEQRLSALEEKINAQSYTGTSKQRKSSRNEQSNEGQITAG